MNENPDAEIEAFWLQLKISMINFYEKNENIRRPISYWSSVLNNYQKNQNYEKIEEYIKKYISLYAIDLLRSISDYHIQILITNICRWNKLSRKFTFSTKEKNYANFIFVLLDIYKSLLRHKLSNSERITIKEIYANFELIILYQDYNQLIDYAISYKKPNILDKLIDYESTIYDTIINDYGISIAKNVIMKGDKLLKLISRKLQNIN
jgi:hypothetical protein